MRLLSSFPHYSIVTEINTVSNLFLEVLTMLFNGKDGKFNEWVWIAMKDGIIHLWKVEFPLLPPLLLFFFFPAVTGGHRNARHPSVRTFSCNTNLTAKLKFSHHTHRIDVHYKGLDQVQIWMTLKPFSSSQRPLKKYGVNTTTDQLFSTGTFSPGGGHWICSTDRLFPCFI